MTLLSLTIPIFFEMALRVLKTFPKEHAWKVLRIGFPSAGENLSYMLSQIVITGMIASLGTDTIAAKVYTEALMGYINILTNSIGHGADRRLDCVLCRRMAPRRADVQEMEAREVEADIAGAAECTGYVSKEKTPSQQMGFFL
ncbi:hypothetical protein [Tumebacillus flagellatus]|uniref:Uncharacterized protein n=1 Tax=Tumebacillus flagellatus TaxID=1157490 RepID=A0A074LHG7_9BACL|nr:hypothetical protein [Tumebacillus flagellatus]KEO81651.1 hypothetical protein EL26_19455 [Tumebacillus flagellatus]